MSEWSVNTSKSGRYTITAQRFYQIDLPRLFGLFNDPESWPTEQPQRLMKLEPNQRIGYSFANLSRVDIRFEQIRNGLYRVTLEHDQLHNELELDWALHYWDLVLNSIFNRLGCEEVVAATAFGKINMYLKVGPLLPTGYHQVATLYQSVNLPETVVVEHAPSWSVNTIGTVTPEHLAAVPTDESNLVVKVAQSLMNSFSVPHARPIQFSVHKTVPVAGGMGGGSADAAAALLAVANFWEMDLSLGQLEVIAARIGADVPFALRGGAARGTGHGEVLTTIRQVSKLHWVLVPNDFGLSTPEVYAELDRLRSARGVDPRGVREAFMLDTLVNNLRIGASAEEIAPLLHNDLEEAAVSLRPELQKVLDLQEQVYALRAIVSGSGPTVAMLARNADDAIAIASRLRTYGQQAVVTSSPAGPARMVD